MSSPLPSAKVDNPQQAAMDALLSGNDIEAAVYGTPSTEAPVVEDAGAPENEAETASQHKSAAEMLAEFEAGTEEAQDTEAAGTPLSKKPTPAKGATEEIVVTGADGVKQRVVVDYADKTKIKKAFEMAAGMRKFQAERDKERQAKSQIEAETKELKDAWSALETAHEEAGIAGLVKLLTGKQDSFEKFLEQEIAKREYMRTATPQELDALKWKEEAEVAKREQAKFKKQIEEQLAASKAKEEKAQQAELSGMVNPAFERYRFAGKIGDAVTEERLDRAIWTQALQQLDSLPEDAEVNREVIDRTFREVSSAFSRAIKQESSKQVKQAVTRAKTNAQEAAAVAASRGMGANAAGSSRQKFATDMRDGKVGDALRDFLSGKINL